MHLEIRQGFGRIVKTIVEKATESLSQDDSALNRETYKAAVSHAFSRLINCNASAPLSTEAIGRLLLSAGITPSAEDMLRWKPKILESDDEESVGSDDELSDSDEDLSDSDDISLSENELSE